MSPAKKILGIFAVVAVLGGGIYGAFSATVSSTGNQFSTGDIGLSADGGAPGAATQPVYFKDNAVPGDNGNNGTECVSIENVGSAAASGFKLYGATAGTPTAALTGVLELTIEEGTGDEKDCSDFAPTSTVYDGSLADFQANNTSFANGVDLGTLAPGASSSYRYTIVLPEDVDPAGIQNASAGNQTFTWEIQS